jgi:ubiquitin carboxyl-terminal hydrolase 5/13|tara:strand:+ start:5607 stop:5720 length:114 start_codon:yes stop_codon:yes gene_type:complete
VAHVLVDNEWYIFNDAKVAKSKEPPKDVGYLYFYKRV